MTLKQFKKLKVDDSVHLSKKVKVDNRYGNITLFTSMKFDGSLCVTSIQAGKFIKLTNHYSYTRQMLMPEVK